MFVTAAYANTHARTCVLFVQMASAISDERDKTKAVVDEKPVARF